ncbi:hypothetical protein [Nocardioides sp. GXZ039]|uniref:hypothetical protein n=1 Tax=Nocardioides sp. GXZ039 TaxID=3136018 RepID=UPI0030F46454
MTAQSSLTWLLDHTLPLNRKERYYTGTVLPGIVCADFRHLNRLTALMGYPDVEASGDPANCGVLFFTEYGIAESAYGPATGRFAELPTARDTPDVVFLTLRPSPVLFALEAKMYDRPGGGELRQQLDLQRELLDPLAIQLASWLGVDEVPVAHRALLPEAQHGLWLDPHQAITWRQVRDAYADIAPSYWLQILNEALDRYDDLVTRTVANDDARMTGEDIVVRFRNGTMPYAAMGRSLGLSGAPLRADVETGVWRRTAYQVAVTDPGNRNWFPVEDFVALTSGTSTRDEPGHGAGDIAIEDPVADLLDALSHARSAGLRVFGGGSVAETLADAEPERLAQAPSAELRRVAALYRASAEAAKLARREASALLDVSRDCQ